MLKLRRAIVVDLGEPTAMPRPPAAPAAGAGGAYVSAPGEQRMSIELVSAPGGEGDAKLEAHGGIRAAVAGGALVGRAEPGDELIVNVQALDLGLGSGGFDIVHVNLTRGLHGAGPAGAHVMKLNYTSLQHTVRAVDDSRVGPPLAGPG